MSNPSPKHSSTPAPARTGQRPDKAHAEKELLDDLNVPRGIPRWQFLFLIGLMIFLLVIWLVPNAMQGLTGPKGNTNPVTVRWERPGHGTVEWHASDVVMQERRLKTAFEVDTFLSFSLGVDARNVKPEDMVRLLVLDQLAEDAGIEITDADLAGHIRETLGFLQRTEADFMQAVRSLGADQRDVEESIRRLLRVARFQQLVGFAGAVPDPKKIEELWHQENVEFAFDYVALPVEGLKEEARGSLPNDTELQAWFDKLPEAEREEFKTAEKRTAEFALFREVENTPAAGLLAAYPEKPAGGAQLTAPEELAHQYYNRVFARRFLKPRAEGEDATVEPSEFQSFEDVQTQCLAEAPIYFAMQRWLDDLKARKTNAETIDFAAEAQKVGLDHQSFLEPQSREEFAASEGLGGPETAEAVFTTNADGSFYFSVVASAHGLLVVRVNERTEPAPQPFESVREKVAEKWLGPKAEELARTRLDALRTGLESFQPEKKEGVPEMEEPPAKEAHYRATADAFRAAAQAAGLEVGTRDWLNKAGPANKEPQWEQEAHKTLFAQANQFGLYRLEPDEVAAPGKSADGKTLYLVRVAGKRDVPLENMSPTQYKRHKQNARSRAIADVSQGMNVEFLRKNYGLWLYQDIDQAHAKAGAGIPRDDEDM